MDIIQYLTPRVRTGSDADIKLDPICGGMSGLLMHQLSFQDGFFKVNASETFSIQTLLKRN